MTTLDSPVDWGAVARLLSYLGRPATPQALFEEHSGAATLAAGARALVARGVDARVVRVRPKELGRLPLPTVVELKGGELAVLAEVRGGRATLDLGGGRRRVVGRREAFTGRALDRTARMFDARHLLGHAVALFREDRVVRRAAVLLLVFAAMVSAVGFGTPVIVATALGTAAPDRARSLLGLLALATFTLAAQRSWLMWLRDRALRFLDARLSTSLRLSLVKKLVDIPLLEAEARGLGPLRQALDAADRATSAALGLLVCVVEGLLGVGYLVLVIVVLPWAALVLVVIAALVVLLSAALGRGVAARGAVLERASERQRFELVEMITGARTIAMAAARRPFIARWLTTFVDEGSAAARHEIAATRARAVVDLAEQGTLAALLVWGGAACLDDRLGVGMVLGVVQAAGSFLWATSRLARTSIDLAELGVHVARVDAVLTIPSLPRAKVTRPSMRADAPLVVLRDVSFRYRDDAPWVLRGLSLELHAGAHVTLSWPSGRGKTTLLRLVAGLAAPTHGTVTVAGIDARHARRLVTYLPQDAHLFAASVLDNLVVLSGGASRERLFAAAGATGLTDIISRWPMRFETLMAPGGANLSGGERQLVVLTACVASERPILLLDESMANIDRIAQAALARRGLLDGRTVLRVVHDEASLGADA